jgi:hypothetical protein
MCDLEDVTFVEQEAPMHNFNVHRKAVCMIDNKTNKCYDLTVDNFLHLGNISRYLEETDIEKEN